MCAINKKKYDYSRIIYGLFASVAFFVHTLNHEVFHCAFYSVFMCVSVCFEEREKIAQN